MEEEWGDMKSLSHAPGAQLMLTDRPRLVRGRGDHSLEFRLEMM